MRENDLKLIAMLGLIVGAVGLGFGAFATWQVQTGGADGEDGDDGDDGIATTIITYDNVIEYPCSSEAAINNALTAIGTGYGIITITDNITLSGTIDIDGRGNYVIQGAGAIIRCASNKRAFRITNARSLTIQNIKIDTTDVSDIGLQIIRIDETNDNPIYIRNVHIIGDDNDYGIGIYIRSDNVWLSECNFYKIRNPIYQEFANKAYINDNVIDDFDNVGIFLAGSNNFIDGNKINGTGADVSIGIAVPNPYNNYNKISNNILRNLLVGGIFVQGNHHTIENNIVEYFRDYGIRVTGNYSLIVGNYNANNTIGAPNPTGILIERGSYNIINANGCYYCLAGGMKARGMWIMQYSYNNTVVGNSCLFNEEDLENSGTDTYLSGNQFY